ncbi:hypothetical protein K8P10_001643 [Leucobacter sp. Psy1]|uniref:hypothetical protein n=1 Tax=Leucobacter sp. Psy1 TaxID=2875729 RepID=UPI001CD1CC69|nr:hypothetical protein [Leucobacter sp. Psy1]UBH06132.1 hypothetical protein K8P10_001643 [Leucobacter sp. Psy1]
MSVWGEAAQTWWKTFLPLGFALVAECLLVFAAGMPTDHGQRASLLQVSSIAPETAARVGGGVDLLTRIGLATLLLVAFLAGFAACMALTPCTAGPLPP